jgi:hypothetical protein
VKLLFERGKTIERLMNQSDKQLNNIQKEHGHTREYIGEQWKQQKISQLSAIETESEKVMKIQIEELVELEDKLSEAQ